MKLKEIITEVIGLKNKIILIGTSISEVAEDNDLTAAQALNVADKWGFTGLVRFVFKGSTRLQALFSSIHKCLNVVQHGVVDANLKIAKLEQTIEVLSARNDSLVDIVDSYYTDKDNKVTELPVVEAECGCGDNCICANDGDDGVTDERVVPLRLDDPTPELKPYGV